MSSPTPIARARTRLRFAPLAAIVMLFGAPALVDAQVVQGVQNGAREGNKAAGPVGGVLGGAIGGVVGVVTGVTGVFTGKNGQQPPPANEAKAPANDAKEAKEGKETKEPKKDGAKTAKTPKVTKLAKQGPTTAVLTQDGAPALTAEQIVASSDGNIDRIKTELNLTPAQEKNWSAFSSAMHYLGHNGADRLNLRIARAKRDPPDDIIEQMRNEAQFLNDRAVDQRGVADAAEPLYASLDDKQKQIFIEEMVRLSHERGLD